MPTALPGCRRRRRPSCCSRPTDDPTVPEVARVFGKAGRAETATDPAPLEMFETTIQFKPREQWRRRHDADGWSRSSTARSRCRACRTSGPPIRNRIDMLATGIKSPVGVKVAAPTWDEIDRLATVERGQGRSACPGVVGAGRAAHRRAPHRRDDRAAAARYGLNGVGRRDAGRGRDGGRRRQRRRGGQRSRSAFRSTSTYPREIRDSLETRCTLPVVTERGAAAVVSAVASIRIADGSADAAQRERAAVGLAHRRYGLRDLRSGGARQLQAAVAAEGMLPAGPRSSGRASSPERATERMKAGGAATLA